MMWGYNTGFGFWWMGFIWLLWLALAAFIVGIVFWLTKKLVEKK